MKNKVFKIIPLIIFIFGLMTIKEGGFVLFDINNAQSSHGNYVPFVVKFNFFSGFIYIFIAFGLYKEKKWVKQLSLIMLFSILVVFLLFLIHIEGGGLYEKKTLFAMIFRTFTWTFISFISYEKVNN